MTTARPLPAPARLSLRRGLRCTCMVAALAGCVWAQSVQASSFRMVHGKVQVLRADQTLTARAGTLLREGDEIVSDEGGEAVVRFDDGARMAVRPDTRLALDKLRLRGPRDRREKAVKLLKGGLRYISAYGAVRHPVAFQTDTATVGIRGTDIEIVVTSEALNDNPAGTYLKVNTGLATLEAVDGVKVEVDPGQVAFGSEPELVPRGLGLPRRPSARKLALQPATLFKSSALDALMK